MTAAGCSRIFTDTISGAATNRPQLARALEHVRAGDALVIWRLDRLGRSLRILTDLAERLEQLDVDLRTLSGLAIDTASPGGRPKDSAQRINYVRLACVVCTNYHRQWRGKHDFGVKVAKPI